MSESQHRHYRVTNIATFSFDLANFNILQRQALTFSDEINKHFFSPFLLFSTCTSLYFSSLLTYFLATFKGVYLAKCIERSWHV